MSNKALAQQRSAILTAWRAMVPAGVDLDNGPLGSLITTVMAPPWKGAISVIEMLAEERGITLDVDLQALPLNEGKPENLRQEYPLFAEIRASLGKKTAAGQPALRQILRGLFGGFNGAEVGIYYQQFLTVRRCLKEGLADLPDPAATWTITAGQARSELRRRLTNTTLVREEHTADLEVFAALCRAERGVGERLKAGGGGAVGAREQSERLDDRVLRDPSLGERLHDRSATPTRGGARAADHGAPSLEAPGTSTVRVKTAGISATAKMATRDGDEALEIEFTAPSTLAPRDAARVARQIAEQLPSNTTPSSADCSVLPTARVRDALEQLADDQLAFIYTWLVLSTAIDGQRLALLQKSDAPPSDLTPHFDGTHLAYQLKNGPVAGAHENSNRIVMIALPALIAQQLRAWGGDTPFEGLWSRVNARLSYTLGNTPGITPTLSRLRATAAHSLTGLAEGPTQAQLLTGGFNFGHIAPGTYRRVSATTLQVLYATQTDALARAVIAISPEGNGLRPWLCGLKAPHELTQSATGSARAMDPKDYAAVFKALRAAALKMDKATERAPSGSLEETKALTEALRLRSAQTYLGFLLGTAARPIAERATAMRVAPGTQSPQHALIMLRDKDSTAYREIRVLPLANDLAKALDALDDSVAQTRSQLGLAGWQILDSRAANRKALLPAWIGLRSRGEAAVQVFTNADLAKVLRDYGITDPRPEPNATRHTVCTALTQILDEPAVHAVMGHAGAGGSYFAPEALATPALGEIKRGLANVLKRAGFRIP